MEVWFSIVRNPGREADTRAEAQRVLHPRSSRAPQESFCSLDKDLSWKSENGTSGLGRESSFRIPPSLPSAVMTAWPATRPRIPSLSSVRTRSMCCLLVSGFLTEITQQIHSLRASGVIPSHFARATGSEMRTFRKSAGTLCTAPGESAFLLMDFILHRYEISLGSLGCRPNWAAEKSQFEQARIGPISHGR